MNKIYFPIKVHAVKLEYRRQKLEKMMHGLLKEIKGKQYVIITHDPDNPKINSRHRRIVKASTKLGSKLSESISAYHKIKAEYDSLLTDWNALYRINPPKVKFPVKQFYDPHLMNNSFFERQTDRCGKYTPDKPTISDHGVLKSKNEQMGADLLKQMDIPFKYETEVYIVNAEETYNPDYLVNFYEIDRCAYLEILGMNDKLGYTAKTITKLNGFSQDGYRPGREIIYVLLYDKSNFDEDYFVSQVLSAFNDMIPDSALIWDSEAPDKNLEKAS